jgi:hypothetical protein
MSATRTNRNMKLKTEQAEEYTMPATQRPKKLSTGRTR